MEPKFTLAGEPIRALNAAADARLENITPRSRENAVEATIGGTPCLLFVAFDPASGHALRGIKDRNGVLLCQSFKREWSELIDIARVVLVRFL